MASDGNEIVLIDLPSRDPRKTWSYNPWKTRLLLNFKGLPYKTEWVEYPNLRPRLEPNITPPPADDPYTSPTIQLPSGEYIMDSWAIADYIEASYPSPPLHLKSEYLTRLRTILTDLMTPLRAVFVPLVPKRILTEESIPYFVRTRTEDLDGIDLEIWAKEKGGDSAWQQAEPHFKQVTAMLKENEGRYFMGETVSYVDFVWAANLLFFRRIGEDVFQKALEISGDGKAHEELLEGVKVWAERDDH
ncbi:hypothetical protein QBC35DRAFT_506174 [Podospora australis]|uniref:GST N-terminal domain-containing protein n=1 Tax=Podospora australis TaxID=1536484 RepID=A0AAN6WN30_9PEZI|nr:hypothetical protein QBC35DRAFT_506174 [Podospora australis]